MWLMSPGGITALVPILPMIILYPCGDILTNQKSKRFLNLSFMGVYQFEGTAFKFIASNTDNKLV